MTQPNSLQTQIFDPFSTQPNPTSGLTQPMDNSGVTDLKHGPSHMCYHAAFGRSSLKHVGINAGELPKIGERWNTRSLGMGGVAGKTEYVTI